MPLTSPRLWVIATPLGNPGDLSPRARRALEGADLVLAEDTRLAARLFRECGIPLRSFTSFFEHNEEKRQEEVLSALRSGGNVALITDAGTPLLSDPGYRLVTACRKENIPVSPIPGPSAPVAALSAAGLPPVPFSFLGFLPRDVSGRKKILEKYAHVPGSLVFFERKDRLEESLGLALEILGPRKFAICREMTKEHEEFIGADLADYKKYCQNLLGEITVVIGPAETESRSALADAKEILQKFLESGRKPREAARRAARELSGWPSKELYSLAWQFRDGQNNKSGTESDKIDN